MVNPPKPVLPLLLSEAFRRVVDGLPARLAEDGFDELRTTHVINVLRHLDCGGSRPADLARRAQMSPQAMGELVTTLERTGYVKRAADPADGRVRLVRLDARGIAAAETATQYFADLETQSRAVLGTSRYDDLVSALATLLDWDAP